MTSIVQKSEKAKEINERIKENLLKRKSVRGWVDIIIGEDLAKLEQNGMWKNLYGDEGKFEDFLRYEYVNDTTLDIRKDELSRMKDSYCWFVKHYSIAPEVLQGAQRRVINKVVSYLNSQEEPPSKVKIEAYLKLRDEELALSMFPHEYEEEEIKVVRCKTCRRNPH